MLCVHPGEFVLDKDKIKFFRMDGKIVYSTDKALIGRIDDKNEKLSRALKGSVVSQIVEKGSILDLAGETRYHVDVVETYLPILNKNREIVGSFEVYIDVTRSHREIGRVVAASLTVLLGILMLVFGVLFVLVAKLNKQLAGAQRDLQAIAITDGLTGMYNRRYLILRAEEEFSKFLRGKMTGLGLILLDIDHFKRINDAHGHLAGDEVLKEVASRIQTTTRTYDIAGRYGGEEFMVILPDASFAEVRAVAERIGQTIRNANVGSHRVTISLGIACTDGTEKDISTVIKRADDGLYKAKESGRDRIAWV